MPLFSFKCLKCGIKVEKFVKNDEQEIKIKCKECDSEEFERVYDFKTASKRETFKDAKDYFDNVLDPEIESIREKISNGDDAAFLDILGE